MLLGILILIGVALVASYFVKLDAGLVAGIRIVLCLLAVLVAFNRFKNFRTPPEGEITYDRHSIVGWALGRELAADFPEGGTVVVMQMAGQSPGLIRMADSELEGLKSGVGRTDFTFVIPDKVSEEREGDAGWMHREEAKSFLEAIQTADAIVAFSPLPLDNLTRSGTVVPPVYVFDAYASGYWKPYQEMGMVKVAVSPDLANAGVTELERKQQESFDTLFDLHRAPQQRLEGPPAE